MYWNNQINGMIRNQVRSHSKLINRSEVDVKYTMGGRGGGGGEGETLGTFVHLLLPQGGL